MIINRCSDYSEMSSAAANSVIRELRDKKRMLLCAATGNSPSNLYKLLGEEARSNSQLFDELTILKLDEWYRVPPDNPASCEHYLRKYVIEPLNISEDRFLAFDGQSGDPQTECQRINRELGHRGKIDICVLGVGVNGHLGFIEPATELKLHAHIATLSDASKNHTMIDGLEECPELGLTLGIKDILDAGKIILLVTGMNKNDIAAKLLKGNISTQIPATMLLLHDNVECYIDTNTVKI